MVNQIYVLNTVKDGAVFDEVLGAAAQLVGLRLPEKFLSNRTNQHKLMSLLGVPLDFLQIRTTEKEGRSLGTLYFCNTPVVANFKSSPSAEDRVTVLDETRLRWVLSGLFQVLLQKPFPAPKRSEPA